MYIYTVYIVKLIVSGPKFTYSEAHNIIAVTRRKASWLASSLAGYITYYVRCVYLYSAGCGYGFHCGQYGVILSGRIVLWYW